MSTNMMPEVTFEFLEDGPPCRRFCGLRFGQGVGEVLGESAGELRLVERECVDGGH